MASYEVRIPLSQGRHDLSVAYVNEYKQPPDEDRNLIVDRFAVEGPLDVARQPQPGRARVLVCDPAEVGEAACAESIVRTFGRRAWRRPLTDLEFERKMHLYSQARTVGADWQEAVRTVLKAFMVSPHFVYRVETAAQPGAGHELSGLELASRLSYFLWSSTPDDRLIDLGLTGALRDPDVLEAEARRMMEDDRADALIENFGGLWLGIRKLDDAAPSVALFPEWDEGLRASMRDEMIAFARQVLLQDRSVYELLTTTETVVDARLAEALRLARRRAVGARDGGYSRAYGVDRSRGPSDRVRAPDGDRAGIAGQVGARKADVLAATAAAGWGGPHGGRGA